MNNTLSQLQKYIKKSTPWCQKAEEYSDLLRYYVMYKSEIMKYFDRLADGADLTLLADGIM